ncbi:MAG: MBL fold metallo-hydrolase [Lachnospiraceae bacterium]|nr:MBL fold metallo-hydrolase [Lachnospiraceae bacterium]
MKLTFVGADHEVTGSCHCLQVGKKKILVDYGMEQGINIFENAELPFDEAMIDYVFLTHAHVDHSGLLPLLYARGFRGQIIMTDATADLCSIMLRDCAHIQMQEAEWKQRKKKRGANIDDGEPIYTMEDADGAIRLIVPFHYDQIYELCDEISFRFTDIGHLLGSASIELWLRENGEERKIVFSGDIGNSNQPLLRDPQLTKEADYVVMESTYGNRVHSTERVDYVGELAKILKETFDRGGNVVIPSFAVGRTQEMLFFLRKIKQERLVEGWDRFDVYVDSPLAVEATGIFQKNIDNCYDEEAKELVRNGINPLTFPGLKLSITSEESKFINFDESPKVILSASGMCEAGRIRHHLKHNLWRPECTILFVGYQALGTLGRTIADGNVDSVKLFGETIEIKAQIKTLAGISGHADMNGLTDWINGFEKQPERVFLVHGEDECIKSFCNYLHEQYGHNTYAPYSGTQFDLLTDEFVYEAEPVAIKKKEGQKRVTEVFARLLAAGNRLLAVIAHNEGGTNKDLAKFADQINSLCDKWDR